VISSFKCSQRLNDLNPDLFGSHPRATFLILWSWSVKSSHEVTSRVLKKPPAQGPHLVGIEKSVRPASSGSLFVEKELGWLCGSLEANA